MSDLILKEEETKTSKTDEAKEFSRFPDVEKDTEQGGSPLLETGKEHKESCIGTSFIKNGCNLLIKKELEMDDYEIENIPPVSRNVYSNEIIKPKQKLIANSRNKVIEQKENVILDNFDYYIRGPYLEETHKLVILSETLRVLDGTVFIGSLRNFSEVAVNKLKENSFTQEDDLVKVEADDCEETTYKDWKIKNEELDIKEDFEESDSSISQDYVGQDSSDKCENYPEKNDQVADQSSLKSILKNDRCSQKTLRKSRLDGRLRRKYKKVNLLKNNKRGYETVDKFCLKKQFRQHRHPGKVNLFKCDKCKFETIDETCLKRHQLLHINSEEMQKFKCDQI